MSDSGNKLVCCPYDKRHVMPERRFMWHLSMNCKAHRERKDEFLICPYNSLHRIEKEYYEAHLINCENKNDYKIDKEYKDMIDLNEQLKNFDIENEEMMMENDWGYHWEKQQKKIETEGKGNFWSDIKENGAWGCE